MSDDEESVLGNADIEALSAPQKAELFQLRAELLLMESANLGTKEGTAEAEKAPSHIATALSLLPSRCGRPEAVLPSRPTRKVLPPAPKFLPGLPPLMPPPAVRLQALHYITTRFPTPGADADLVLLAPDDLSVRACFVAQVQQSQRTAQQGDQSRHES